MGPDRRPRPDPRLPGQDRPERPGREHRLRLRPARPRPGAADGPAAPGRRGGRGQRRLLRHLRHRRPARRGPGPAARLPARGPLHLEQRVLDQPGQASRGSAGCRWTPASRSTPSSSSPTSTRPAREPARSASGTASGARPPATRSPTGSSATCGWSWSRAAGWSPTPPTSPSARTSPARVLVGRGPGAEQLEQLRVGSTATVRWRLAKAPVFAISGESILLRDGAIAVRDDRFLHPRTAVGIDRDTGGILLLVDRRPAAPQPRATPWSSWRG